MEDIPPNHFYWIIHAELLEKGFVNHHIAGMNTFYDKGIEQIITSVFKLERTIDNLNRSNPKDQDTDHVQLEITFTKVYISAPTTVNSDTHTEEPLYPLTAIRRELTYEGNVHVDAHVRAVAFKRDGSQYTREEDVTKQFLLKMPIMVKSMICHLHGLSKMKLLEMGEDPEDTGGYFIINGLEKVIDCVENTAYNQPRIFVSNYEKEYIRCEMISQPGDYYLNSEQFIIRWNKDGGITIEIHRDGLAGIRVPFYMLFRLMDWSNDKMIAEYVLNGDFTSGLSRNLFNFLQKAFVVKYTDYDVAAVHDVEALLTRYAEEVYKMSPEKFDYLKVEENEKNWQELRSYVRKRMYEHFLPHIGKKPEHNHDKMRFIAKCIRDIFLVHFKILSPTDRDSYDTKRISSAGDSFAKAFKNKFNDIIIHTVRKKISDEFRTVPFDNINFQQLMKIALANTDFSKGIRTIFSSATVGTNTTRKHQNRMTSQQITRKNELSTISTLRAITENGGASATTRQSDRAIEMREQHPTYIGYVCLGQSPLNGDKVGLTKQCAISMTLTKAYSSEIVRKALLDDKRDLIPLAEVTPRDIYEQGLIYVYVNGFPLGFCRDAFDFIDKYRRLRRAGSFAREISISHSHQFNSVTFYADANRPVRPLIIVYNTERNPEMFPAADRKKWRQKVLITPATISAIKANKMTMKSMCDQGMIEYIDAIEQTNAFICPDYQRLLEHQEAEEQEYTHLEIPMALFGFVALSSPFANHNEPVRLLYQSSQASQTMGLTANNWALRTNEKDVSIQYNLEEPLVNTISSRYVNPNGLNVIVAVMSYSGTNVEDSMTFNGGSIGRGLFRSFKITNYKAEYENKEYRRIPEPTSTMNIKSDNYESLSRGEIFGLPKHGSLIRKDSPLIAKIYKFPKTPEDRADIDYVDKSTIYKDEEPAIVHDTLIYKHEHDRDIAKVILHKPRAVDYGDKFSARSGQKGVVSGILRESDMPFTEDGLVPDLLINPHSFPSRMTMGQYYEMLVAKHCIMEGIHMDGTIFSKVDEESIGKLLELHGYNKKGYERMYSGITGRFIDAMIYVGPTFYQRLQKSAIDQENTVSNCPTDAMTFQPLDGKAAHGGIRFGEMERDALGAHGTTKTVYEKLFNHSDGYSEYRCKCGQPAIVNVRHKIYTCKICGPAAQISKINTTWTAKMVRQEFATLNINMSCYPEPRHVHTQNKEWEAMLVEPKME